MFAALKRFFGKKGPVTAGDEASKGVAKSRLHFVLVQDRTGLTSEEMADFKQELINVINRFFEINCDALDVSYKRDTGMTTLLINSPVLVRRRQGVGDPPPAKKVRPGKTKPESLKAAVAKEVVGDTEAPDPIQRSKKALGDEDADAEEILLSVKDELVSESAEVKTEAKGPV